MHSRDLTGGGDAIHGVGQYDKEELDRAVVDDLMNDEVASDARGIAGDAALAVNTNGVPSGNENACGCPFQFQKQRNDEE